MRDYVMYFICMAGITIAGYGINLAGNFLKVKMQKEKAQAQAEGKQGAAIAFDTAAKVLSMVTETTVASLEQTKAKDLRILVKDGKIVRGELLAVADEAYQQIRNTIKDDVLETLNTGVNDIDAYIKALIEEKLLELKNTSLSLETRELEVF